MTSSGEVSPTNTLTQNAPKFGTLIPNRIFVGGIAANTTETELRNFFAAYGKVKDSKIITDRGGVSKGYGFITFETPEDAEKIIEKEANNLVFKDRKLNIGQAIRKQPAYSRPEASFSPVLFSNGIQYSYQNGLAIFQSQDGSHYPIAQPTPQYPAVMVPQPLYLTQPQYSTTYQNPAMSQNWASTAAATAAAAAAAAGQWRWAPQSTAPALAAAPNSYLYQSLQQGMSPESLVYAQPLPHQAYQAQDIGDTAAIMDTEGSMEPILPSSTHHTYVTDMASSTAAYIPTTSTSQQQQSQLVHGHPLPAQIIAASMHQPQTQQQQPVPASSHKSSTDMTTAGLMTAPSTSAQYVPYQNQQHTNKAYYAKMHVSPRKPYSTQLTMLRKPVRSVTKMINGTSINIVQELCPEMSHHEYEQIVQQQQHQGGPLTPPPTPM